MAKPTKAKVKEFWELCELIHKKEKRFDYWYNSLGILEAIMTPPIDLIFLFQYAVPMINKLGYKVRMYQMANNYWFVELLNPTRIGCPPHKADKQLKDALFRVLYPILKEASKK